MHREATLPLKLYIFRSASSLRAVMHSLWAYELETALDTAKQQAREQHGTAVADVSYIGNAAVEQVEGWLSNVTEPVVELTEEQRRKRAAKLLLGIRDGHANKDEFPLLSKVAYRLDPTLKSQIKSGDLE